MTDDGDPLEDEVIAFFKRDRGPLDTKDEAALRAQVRRLEGELAKLRAERDERDMAIGLALAALQPKETR